MKLGTLGGVALLVSCLVNAISLQHAFLGPEAKDMMSLQMYSQERRPSGARFNRFGAGMEKLSSVNAAYSMRIKKNDPQSLGVDTVEQYSGYLDLEDDKHFFYWMFESRSDPANDPVILWLSGGPGASGFLGLFFELGPSLIGEDLKPEHNPWSWNNNATLVFIDQPIGVGFSHGKHVDSSALAGVDVVHFLEMFYKKFPHLAKNPFHLAGESYGGHFVPSIAHEILAATTPSDDEDEKKPKLFPDEFRLTSVMIGNGITDPLIQYKYFEPMACGRGGFPAVLEPAQCAAMNASARRCETLNKLCYATGMSLPCVAASTYCDNFSLKPIKDAGLNVYDLRTTCALSGPLCYRETDFINAYLNQPDVQEALGADVENFSLFSDEVYRAFYLTGDSVRPSQLHIARLLDRGIPVLLYAGDKDYICNWLGNKAWSDALGWLHTYKYRNLPLKPWINERSQEVGQVKSFGGFTFLRIYDAGHLVPHDQPEVAHFMLQSWISGNYNLDYFY